jgi:hypothetical protein
VEAAKAGATFMEGLRADKVLFQNDDKRVASVVEGTWTSRDSYLGLSGEAVRRKVIIIAKKVIVSCGTLQNPLLLPRGGLKNSQIGRYLHLHPGKYPFSQFYYTIYKFENLDGRGHGVKIESVAMLPSVVIPVFPWRDGHSTTSCSRLA